MTTRAYEDVSALATRSEAYEKRSASEIEKKDKTIRELEDQNQRFDQEIKQQAEDLCVNVVFLFRKYSKHHKEKIKRTS